MLLKTDEGAESFSHQMLLGLKKRGFGKDMFVIDLRYLCTNKWLLISLSYLFLLFTRIKRYNGFGGKIEPGETPLEAAVRELKVKKLPFSFIIRSVYPSPTHRKNQG